MSKTKPCIICGREMIAWDEEGECFGNNAEPVCEGECCDFCDKAFVIPARMSEENLDFIKWQVKFTRRFEEAKELFKRSKK